MSGREQAAPGQEGEERPGPLWEGGLHRGFQSALRAISKEAKGDEKWAAVSAELATAGIEKTSEQCKVYFKQAKKRGVGDGDAGKLLYKLTKRMSFHAKMIFFPMLTTLISMVAFCSMVYSLVLRYGACAHRHQALSSACPPCYCTIRCPANAMIVR